MSDPHSYQKNYAIVLLDVADHRGDAQWVADRYWSSRHRTANKRFFVPNFENQGSARRKSAQYRLQQSYDSVMSPCLVSLKSRQPNLPRSHSATRSMLMASAV